MLRRGFMTSAAAALASGCATPSIGAQARRAATPAFPGAEGWAAGTPGGRGGRVIRVTSLAGAGPGSFREAVEAEGLRIVVFEVGGVIDLDRQVLNVREPFITIAGQTAPSPGVTLIRGGINIRTHDVVVRHLRVRPGEAGAAKKSGWEVDGIATISGAHDVIVDHCSCTWATDENLSASGPRHEGAGPDDWRRATSHRITFSNNIVAEGLSNATHSKGEHSKGTLIHDNVTGVLILANLYAHNRERNPLFKGGAQGAIVNNLIYNPGKRTSHYNLHPSEWGEHAYQAGQVSQVGNVVRLGPSTESTLPLFMAGGAGELQLHQADNIAVDRTGAPLPRIGRFGEQPSVEVLAQATPPAWPQGLKAMPAAQVEAYVLANAGARPWDRDAIDRRIVADVAARRGAVIDSEQAVGGYPRHPETRRPFNPAAWNLATMTARG